MTTRTLVFTHRKLITYLTCQRRYQLSYETSVAWPDAPLPAEWREKGEVGRAFHQMVERYFSGIDVDDSGEDANLKRLWNTFLRQGPDLPPGKRLPELTLTVPLGNSLLAGRFDLLILGTDSTHIFDWKTGSARRSRAELTDDWQTIVYLALLAEGASALFPGGSAIEPEQISLTYWFAEDPAHPTTLHYSAAAHRDSWARLSGLVDEIVLSEDRDGVRPLTSDLRVCGRCTYQVYCGRQDAPSREPTEWELEFLREPAVVWEDSVT